MFRTTRIAAVATLLLAAPFTAAAGDSGGADPEPVLTPNTFYESFNIRTIRSSIGPAANAYCESYPHEYFEIVTPENALERGIGKKDLSRLGEDLLILEGFGRSWWIRFEGRHTITISDTVLKGTYRHKADYKLYFNPEKQEWWADTGHFIDIAPDCIPVSAYQPLSSD